MSDLRCVPGIGAKKEKELIELGYDSLEALRSANPDELYLRASSALFPTCLRLEKREFIQLQV